MAISVKTTSFVTGQQKMNIEINTMMKVMTEAPIREKTILPDIVKCETKTVDKLNKKCGIRASILFRAKCLLTNIINNAISHFTKDTDVRIM